MKIKISYTIDLDATAWAEEFGIDKSEVRADVQQYLTRIGREFVEQQLGL